MRTATESDVPSVPRWSLWLVAAFVSVRSRGFLLLGVLVLPFWVGMLAALLIEPERSRRTDRFGTSFGRSRW